MVLSMLSTAFATTSAVSAPVEKELSKAAKDSALADKAFLEAKEKVAAAQAAEAAAKAAAEAKAERGFFGFGGKKKPAAAAATAAAAPEAAAAVEAAPVIEMPPGDVKQGAALFKAKCATCHTATDGGPNKQGPNLYGIIDTKSGAVPGFGYTKANKESGVTWTNENMYEFLKNPKAFIKGTSMAFPGFKKDQDRADVTAYLDTLK